MEELRGIEKPASRDLVTTRGNSLHKRYVFRTTGGERIALTGLSGVADVRDTPDGVVLATLTVSVDQSIQGGPTAGEVTISAPGDDMDADINGFWQVTLDDGSPNGIFRKTLIAGGFRTERK